MTVPPLTREQKRSLARPEPQLHEAANRGDYDTAKRAAGEIQVLLRSTGHETRLMQSKNWLFQAAMEHGELTTALMGFNGVRKKTAPTTRVYLEATALSAICELRRGNLDAAKPLMGEALRRSKSIKSETRRLQFHKRMIERFEQEWVIAVLRQDCVSPLDIDQIQDDAGQLVRTSTVEQIEEYVGSAVPSDIVQRMLAVYEFSRRQLPAAEQRCLPDPNERRSRNEVGRTLISSAKRVIWRSLCDPNSGVYKIWFEHGVKAVLDEKLLTTSVVAALAGVRVAHYTLTVAVTATVLKAGLEIFCDRFDPSGLMIDRTDRG